MTVNVTGLGLTGVEAEHILRYDCKIQCELSDAKNVLFLITYADTEDTVGRLIEALHALAEKYRNAEVGCSTDNGRQIISSKEEKKDGAGMRAAAACGIYAEEPALPPVPETGADPRTAFFASKERIPFEASAGRIAAEQIMFYPPGIPILAPGDRVSAEAVSYIRAMQRIGCKVVGPEDASLKALNVLAEPLEAR